ncbi:MAG: xylulokinase [Ardenticatenaceae bacterium]|nr:xylulokinase [Ardenticatenaceae bacterium]
MMNCFLGIDLGTSSVKVALFSRDHLALVGETSREYAVAHPRPGTAEQNPADWWIAVVDAVRRVTQAVDPTAVQAIGLDGQMHGCVCVDRDGEVIYPAVIWADSRAAAEVDDLTRWQNTTNALLPGRPAAGFAAATMWWLRRHRPDIVSRTAAVLSVKDWVRWRLTGEIAADHSDASAMWLYDLSRRDWSADLITHIGWRIDQLPPLKFSGEMAGPLRASAAAELGLPAAIPVAIGAADLAAQALGHGVISPGQLLATVGTGGQILTPLARPEIDPLRKTYTFAHASPNRFYQQAAILAAGLALRWLRDLLGMTEDGQAYAKLSALAADVTAGAEGLLFLPYLAGERSPHMDPLASGQFLGLRLHHTPGHLARAVMEGVCFALKDCLALMPGPEGAAIVLSGGIAKSAVWRQMAADIWQRPLLLADERVPYAALGSAMLAGVASGYFQSVEEASTVLTGATAIVEPASHPIYDVRYALFRDMYPHLKPVMRDLRRNPTHSDLFYP